MANNIAVTPKPITWAEISRLQAQSKTRGTPKPPDQFYAAVLQQIYAQGGFAGLNIVIESGNLKNA